MSWHFRAVEIQDDTWSCRWGNQDFDEHPTLADAIDHLRQLASRHQPALLFVHRRDGSVSQCDWPDEGAAAAPS
ncbi:MAG: DUF2188 domain-containing protein [Nocardioides sp.]